MQLCNATHTCDGLHNYMLINIIITVTPSSGLCIWCCDTELMNECNLDSNYTNGRPMQLNWYSTDSSTNRIFFSSMFIYTYVKELCCLISHNYIYRIYCINLRKINLINSTSQYRELLETRIIGVTTVLL